MTRRVSLTIKPLLAVLSAAFLWGCGTANDSATVQAPSFNASGRHPANWADAHGVSSQSNIAQCKECHGADLSGGIANVSCSSGSFGGLTCHPHPFSFKDPALHGAAAKKDLVACQKCHGEAGGPGSNPRFNIPKGSLTNGCEAAGCHNRNNPALPALFSAHPVPWQGHAGAGNLANACALCHGITLGGGTGPACAKCHTAGSPVTLLNCTSCHGNPPNGSLSPNIAGRHDKHTHLSETQGTCASCHTGAGTGTAKHANGTVDVNFLTAYNAKTGTASYNPTNYTCSNVSCHGGKATPSWRTGTIDVNADPGCRSCHQLGTAQYNSYFSGQHAFHAELPPAGLGIRCTDCHDIASLNAAIPPSHFSGLGTPEFELAPRLTIRADVNYSGGSCLPQSGPNFSITVCHIDARRKSW